MIGSCGYGISFGWGVSGLSIGHGRWIGYPMEEYWSTLLDGNCEIPCKCAVLMTDNYIALPFPTKIMPTFLPPVMSCPQIRKEDTLTFPSCS